MLSGEAASLSFSRNSRVSKPTALQTVSFKDEKSWIVKISSWTASSPHFISHILNSNIWHNIIFLPSRPTDEMKTFAGQQIEPLFQFSWLVVFLTLLLCGSVAVVLGFTVNPKLAIAVSLSLLALLYIFFGEDIKPKLEMQCWCAKSLVLNLFGSGTLSAEDINFEKTSQDPTEGT